MFLCKYCQLVRIDAAVVGTHFDYGRKDVYPDLGAMEVSANLGCSFCGLLRDCVCDRISARFQDNLDALAVKPEIEIYDLAINTENGALNDEHKIEKDGTHRITFFVETSVGKVQVPFSVYADEESAAAKQSYVRRRLPHKGPLHDNNISKVLSLIELCDKQHGPCLRRHAPDRLPSRLLEVKLDDSGSIRFIDSSELGKNVKYIALSHTWGPPSGLLTTTHATMSDRMKEILIEDLPANFQDAVTVSRALGVHFIWIDSLCIIQDSAIDWATESSKMDGIYKNAHLTIAATKSGAAHEGFLQTRTAADRAMKFPYMTANNDHTNPLGHIYLVPYDGHWLEGDHDMLIEDSKWNSRGWTLQERILSKRVLHFTKSMLHFECRCMDWMEDDRATYAAYNRTPWLGSAPGGYFYDSKTEMTTKMLYDSWFLIVELYSKRQLTKSQDILPALSGTAHEMRRLSGDVYIAGLWRRMFCHQLLWNTLESTTRPAESYRGPSWSWISVQGQIDLTPVYVFTEGYTNAIELVEMSISPSTPDELGRIDSASIVVEGQIQPLSRVQYNAPRDTGHWTHTLSDTNGDFISFGRLDIPTPDAEGPCLYALLVLKSPKVINGIILRKIVQSVAFNGPETFRRIGTLAIYSHGQTKRHENIDFFETAPTEKIRLV